MSFIFQNSDAQNVSFDVSFTEPQAHYADVTMTITNNKSENIDLKMPVWTPGSYLIREFAKSVESFGATDGSNNLKSEKINKNTWRVYAGKKGKVVVSYRVYAFEISVRTSFVDASHAFLSPTGIFMYPEGGLKQSSTVKIEPYKGWSKISTGLNPVSGKTNTFTAPDFDILYDSPIEVGNQDVFEFTAAGVKHEVAMYGGGNYSKEMLKRDMPKIVEAETAIFSENPNKRYVFIVHNYSIGSGGLEHLNSTTLGVARNSYNSESGYLGFLRLMAHEYFHLWNVKRLRPIALGPFNYNEENYTTNLWIAEGFTSYFENLALRRAGFNSPEKCLDVIVDKINTVENIPGSKMQSASESSFDAWIKQYRPTENSKNIGISYYDKGAVIGMAMDLEILNATNGKARLDDVMRSAYNEYYKKLGRGYTDAEFKSIVEKISGISFTDFYNKYVYGAEPIDYKKYLGYAGLSIENTADDNAPYLGISTSQKDGKLVVTSVSRGSAAWDGGINVNDELISVEGIRVNYSADPRVNEIDRVISNYNAGDKITVVVSRDGIIREQKITLGKNPNVKYRVSGMSNISDKQRMVREIWLSI